MTSKAMQEAMSALDAEIATSMPPAFAPPVKDEFAKRGKAVRCARIRPE